MNLWILTEERPKKEVLRYILEKFIKDRNITCFIDNLRILPEKTSFVLFQILLACHTGIKECTTAPYCILRMPIPILLC